MNEKKLQQYAELIVNVGIRVQPKEEVWIYANLDQPEFITKVVEECYKAKAKKVVVHWNYEPITKLNYKHMSLSELSKVAPYRLAEFKYRAKKLPTMLHIVSDDPDALKGVNMKKVSTSRMKSYPKIKPYLDASDGKYKWCIVGVPGEKWAKKVFPKLNKEEAIEKLWDAILLTSRVDETNTVKNWNEHNAFLDTQKKKMEKYNFQYLEYKASNGTDFKVELNPICHWGAGSELTNDNRLFNPNIPTEEVFTTPIKGKCEGKVVASKPLVYMGTLIEDFYFVFKDGKVSEVHARTNQQVLEQMVKMDESASYLGEVALVPYTSPINQSGVLFYDTLYDENAVCHLALGAGFKELLDGGADMSVEDSIKKGINDSMIHTDFMIGTPDLSIVGITHDGKRVQVFKDGVWAI